MRSVRYFLIVLSFLHLFCPLKGEDSHVIEGTVYDAQTKERIPGVVIYLDGTSINTVSDYEGFFRFSVEKKIHTNLVFRHLSYETLVIQHPFEHDGNAFYLTENVNTLGAVTVVSDHYSHAEKMKIFREAFLGLSAAGKSCVLLNEEAIVLKYDHKTNCLMGYAHEPIVIDNKYLAYCVIYDLRSFSVQYRENTLDMAKATMVAFTGTSFFVDQSPDNLLFRKRREKAYAGSSRHFWKSLVDNTLDDSNFAIYNRFISPVDPHQYFSISEVSPQKKEVLIIPGTNINRNHSIKQESQIFGVIGIRYNVRYTSEVVFLTNRFLVDEFGNPDAIESLLFSGDMGDRKMGEMLPLDFKLDTF